MRRLIFATLFATSVAACQSLLDFQGGAPATVTDAGSQPGDAAIALDALASDALASDRAVPPSPPCTVDFCDDFEGETDGGRWFGTALAQGGEMTFVDVGARGSRGALRVQTPASANQSPTAQLLFRRNDAPKTVRITFRVFIEDMTKGVDQIIVVHQLETINGAFNATFGVNGQAFMFRWGGEAAHELPGEAKLREWIDVEMMLYLDKGVVSIKVDGADRLNAPSTAGIKPPTRTWIDFGLYRGGAAAAPTQLLLDDFTLEIDP